MAAEAEAGEEEEGSSSFVSGGGHDERGYASRYSTHNIIAAL